TCPYIQFYDRIRSSGTIVQSPTNPRVLPIDDHGVCLFHSKEVDWKRQNDFKARFFELVKLLDAHDAERYYDFTEFVFLGGDHANEGNKEPLLRITGTTFKKQTY